jgi:hypothetical protein
LTQQASAWSKDYQTQYLLGDNDSRLSAKQNALAQTQLQAAQEAGTYIQGSTSLVSDQLEERINQVSAAVVTVAVVSERFELTANGQLRLSLTARANVDESILKERVRAIQQEAGKAAELQKMAQANDQIRQQLDSLAQQRQNQQPLLSALQEQQQKLAADNQQLRQQLQLLAKQRAAQAVAPPTTPNVQQPLSPLENNASDLQPWLAHLVATWQQTPMQAKVVLQRPSTDGQFYDLAVQVDWQLSLKPGSPLAELCQRWTCALGYAYRAPFDDANLSPLHQQLFRPISRLAHIDDKYINHWQLLTVQVYPPSNLTAAEQQSLVSFFANNSLTARATLAGQSFELPFLHYDVEQNALVIRIKGAMNTTKTTVYDSGARTGEFICAMAYSKQLCVGDELSPFVLHRIRLTTEALQEPLVVKAVLVGF